MTVETIPILQGAWRLLRWLPDFLLKVFFTRERLAQLIYVDIRPRFDPVSVDLGPTPSFSIYLQVINLSPFSVELDRAEIRFTWQGVTPLKTSILRKQTIAPGEIATLNISDSIPDGYANQMAKLQNNRTITVDGNMEYNCKVRTFAKTIGRLDGIEPKIYNLAARTNDV